MSSFEDRYRDVIPGAPLWKYISLAPTLIPAWQDRLRQLAVEGRAYLPSPREFNDPFDCLPHIPTPGTREEIEQSQEHLIAKMIRALPGMPPEEVARQMKAGLARQSPETFSASVIEALSKTSREMGVFCLSETIDSVLMWSHYAANHRGIALQFDFRKQHRGGLMPLFKVCYSELRPQFRNIFDASASDDLAEALATKAVFWEYEQEWRALMPRQAGKFVDFDPDVVTGIAFGVNCAPGDRAAVQAVVKGRSISFFEARPTRDTFKLEVVPL